jgi:Fur family transcriptional regulator, ferric uptake regulator
VTSSAAARSNVVRIPVRGRFATERLQRALEVLHQVVVANGLRMTTARRAILTAVLSKPGRFDAFGLLDTVRASGSLVSLAAIYRNMPLMIEAGIVRATLASPSSSQLYDVTFEQRPNDHLVCRICGTVAEFDFEAFDALRSLVAKTHDFTLTSYVHQLSGVCLDCQGKKKR